MLVCTVAASAMRFSYGFNQYPSGHSFAMLGEGSGTATVGASPSGSGNAVCVKCAAYNQVPSFDITLPEGVTLGNCSRISLKLFIPSSGNEQYANYKQMQLYLNGSLFFKNVNAEGKDAYPNQGNKDAWLVKDVELSTVTLGEEQKALSTFTLSAGLNDNKMTYYIGEVLFSYDLNLPDPVIPTQGAFYTGKYRNLFAEAGYTDAQVQQRIDDLWATYFTGDKDTQRLYYEAGDDMAYILDVNNGDVRSEGMSYGMMMCVQMDKKHEFDALWKWAKTYMQFPSTDERRGYFAWQMNTDGTVKGKTPASDGEEYFVMALMFAANRWGNGEGIYNYMKEANYILEMSKEKPAKAIAPYSSYTPLFNVDEKQVVFVPYATAAKFSNPSYHLPAFYELWAKWADTNNDFYMAMAAKSRELYPVFAHAQTGLMPDYSDFNGQPHKGDGDHSGFLYDAWRCMMNMAIDFAWFKPEGVPYQELIKRQYAFFLSKGITAYHSVYNLDGTDKNGNTDHSPGLVACNASGAVGCDTKDAYKFVENFFDTAIPTGKYRYYDGCLYMLNWLNCAGRYRIYAPGFSTGICSEVAESISVTVSAEGDLRVSGASKGAYTVVSLSSGITLASGEFAGHEIALPTLAKGVYAVKVTAKGHAPIVKKFIF